MHLCRDVTNLLTYNSWQDDFNHCDLLIVTGTSLTVSPFNMLPSKAPRNCPRLLVNLKMVGDDLPDGFDVQGRRRGGKEVSCAVLLFLFND